MKIDIYKYIQLLLPIALRIRFFVNYLFALLQDLINVQDLFETRADAALYDANANASVISMTHNIKRKLGVDVEISELDGRPVDFLVEAKSYVDEYQLRKLLDTIKLSGKSYRFRINGLVFVAEWSDYVCEDITEIFVAEWSDYVCEDLPPLPDNRVYIGANASRGSDGWYIQLIATKKVTSDIHVSFNYTVTDGGVDMGTWSQEGTIPNGQSMSERIYGLDASSSANVIVQVTSISPIEDSNYKYVIR